MRLGTTARLRRFLAVALIALMSAAPAVASGFSHSTVDTDVAMHCHDDAAHVHGAPHATADHKVVGEDMIGDQTTHRHDAATDTGPSQTDHCFNSCCGMACHATIAILTGLFIIPSSDATPLAPCVFAGFAQRNADRIDRPPISRL